ncbi:ABC transporter ATP-binding protein [bacterium]|nr:ABC transporter ATP-binding protein [bacterium]
MSNFIDIEPGTDSDLSIYLKDISVQFSVPNEPINTFKEYSIRLIQGKIKKEKFWALKKINLHVNKGEIFGILGRNGAGKSTLLKVVSRVMVPTEGRVWIKGVVSPLLQLGAGFHPELTGMENIFLNATLLGHTHKEINEKINDIIDFAEIGNFIEAPIRTYSSGMKGRLGFAVATAWKPDILILDEVLSVGDVAFRKKCYDRMANYRDSGATVLMVSHSIGQIRELCGRAMWLDHGEIQLIDTADEVCNAYGKAMER